MFVLFYLISGCGVVSRVSGDSGVVSGVVLNSINRAVSCYELSISFTKKYSLVFASLIIFLINCINFDDFDPSNSIM